jgi:hypothetical protein
MAMTAQIIRSIPLAASILKNRWNGPAIVVRADDCLADMLMILLRK